MIFFSDNYRDDRELNLAKHFAEHIVKTCKAVDEYKKEGKIHGGAPCWPVGALQREYNGLLRWYFEKGMVRGPYFLRFVER